MPIPPGFKGRAKRLDDVDLPRLGNSIGVGEDEIHAVLDVESRGYGFDKQGRPLILFEPHIFWRLLGEGAKRDRAVREGLAYRDWRPGAYPADSYPRLLKAMAIDEAAALKACSWGLGQILGSNHKAAGYATVQEMVAAFCDDEEHHLAAMVQFIKTNGLDRHLRARDWRAFARGYNGPGYAKNQYDVRLARRFAIWQNIKNTPWLPVAAERETVAHEASLSAQKPATAAKPAPAPAPAPKPVLPQPASAIPANAAPGPKGFWRRLFRF